MNSHAHNLKIRLFDERSAWEQVIEEILEIRRELCKRLDGAEAILRETCAGLRDVEDRLDKIEGPLNNRS